MQALFALTRFPNLVIVILTQCLLYYLVLIPAMSSNDIERTFNDQEFGIFVLITVLITAGGNIINDLLDYPTDVINKPHKVIIEKKVAASTAYWLYFSFNLLGYILSLYLAFILQFLPYLFLYPFAVSGLYLYSHSLKRKPLLGNLTIAFYCGAVAAVLLLTEKEGIFQLYAQDPNSANRVIALFLWYIVFAFFATLYRELIKDLQDEIGDRATGLRTAPIAWGQKTTKILTFLIGFCLFLFIIIWSVFYLEIFSRAACLGLGLGVILPLIYTLVSLYPAKMNQQFHKIREMPLCLFRV